jgi:predicted RNA binding protein YcfA (HicA-like mRNA interferase family)
MGRLAGFTAADVVRKLRRAGFSFDRSAKGSHEIWRNADTRRRTTVPQHPGALPEGLVRAIVAQAGLTANEFLEL